MPRVWVPVTSMTTYAGWIVNNSGCVTASTAHVSCIGAAHEPFLVQTHVGAAEERQQIGQDRGQWCADSANGSDACGARQQLVSEVEAAHRERAAALEHDGRRLGIAQDIELSGRSAVAVGGAAAHRTSGGSRKCAVPWNGRRDGQGRPAASKAACFLQESCMTRDWRWLSVPAWPATAAPEREQEISGTGC